MQFSKWFMSCLTFVYFSGQSIGMDTPLGKAKEQMKTLQGFLDSADTLNILGDDEFPFEDVINTMNGNTFPLAKNGIPKDKNVLFKILVLMAYKFDPGKKGKNVRNIYNLMFSGQGKGNVTEEQVRIHRMILMTLFLKSKFKIIGDPNYQDPQKVVSMMGNLDPKNTKKDVGLALKKYSEINTLFTKDFQRYLITGKIKSMLRKISETLSKKENLGEDSNGVALSHLWKLFYEGKNSNTEIKDGKLIRDAIRLTLYKGYNHFSLTKQDFKNLELLKAAIEEDKPIYTVKNIQLTTLLTRDLFSEIKNKQKSLIDPLTTILTQEDKFEGIEDPISAIKLTQSEIETLRKNGYHFLTLINQDKKINDIEFTTYVTEHGVLWSNYKRFRGSSLIAATSVANLAKHVSNATKEFYNLAKQYLTKSKPVEVNEKSINTEERRKLTEVYISIMWALHDMIQKKGIDLKRGSMSIIDKDKKLYNALVNYAVLAGNWGTKEDLLKSRPTGGSKVEDVGKGVLPMIRSILSTSEKFSYCRISSHFEGLRLDVPNKPKNCQFGVSSVFESNQFPATLFPGGDHNTHVLYGWVQTMTREPKLFVKIEEHGVGGLIEGTSHAKDYFVANETVTPTDHREKDLPIDVAEWLVKVLMKYLKTNRNLLLEKSKYSENIKLILDNEKDIIERFEKSNHGNRIASKYVDVSMLKAIYDSMRIQGLYPENPPAIFNDSLVQYRTGNEVVFDWTEFLSK